MAIRSNTPLPLATETPTRTVRADDLTQALARVRLTYGKDAMVLGTRTVTVPDAQSLRPRRQVEVTVVDPNAQSRAMGAGETPWTRAYEEAAGSTDSAFEADTPTDEESVDLSDVVFDDTELETRVDRLDTIAHRVRDLTSKLDGMQDEAGDYPLAHALRAAGTTEETIQHLAGSFRLAVRGGDANETAARRHLSRFVRGTRAIEVAHLRGEHWFLGRAGSGKTTLVLYLAGCLRAAGLDAAVIAVAPPHAGEVERLRGAERALGISLHVVEDLDGMNTARRETSECDAVLVDTPCFVGKELPIAPPEHAQRHLVVPLGEAREHLRAHLDRASGWQADCLALTQMDLYPRPGRLVDLAVESGRPVSLLQGRQEGTIRVAVARGEGLLTAVLGERDRAFTL